MISSQQSYLVRISHLETHEQRYGLKAVVAAIHIVAEEEIRRFWRLATDIQHVQHIKEVTMNVADNGYGRIDLLAIILFDEQLFGQFKHRMEVFLA